LTGSQNLYLLNGLAKEFQLGKLSVVALRGLTLAINTGEIVALRGPSGSGKSTLLNILGLIEVPTKGVLSFMGKKTTELSERELTNTRRQAIGFIFQNYNLLPILTAQENVEYPLHLIPGLQPQEITARAAAVLAAVGLGDFRHHKPAQLSGGQQQRVSIARALVKQPKVILADEPTANLDSKNATQILHLLQKLKTDHGSTVVIATHDEATASFCDRRLELMDGQLMDFSPAPNFPS